MIINPREAIAAGWITGDIPEDHIQPNGIDFTVDSVYTQLNTDQTFFLGLESKTHTQWKKYDTFRAKHSDGIVDSWFLKAQGMYDFSSPLRVQLPADGVSALLIGRSTLNRNGVFITSGWYDSAFEGQISGMLRTSQANAIIAKGARIGQIIFFKSDAAKAYNGQYQGNAGHWTEGTA